MCIDVKSGKEICGQREIETFSQPGKDGAGRKKMTARKQISTCKMFMVCPEGGLWLGNKRNMTREDMA